MASTERRPIPADPTPHLTAEDQIPGNLARSLPPELGPNAIAVLQSSTFMYSDAVGDVRPGSIGGLVHDDTRFIDRWELTLNGAQLLALSSGTVEPYSSAFFLTNPELPDLQASHVGSAAAAVRRRRPARADPPPVVRG